MAIISIPTSVAGVTIPGAAIKGPLGALFGNKYDSKFLQYPRDLSSATKGHVVQFSVNEVEPTQYKENTITKTDDSFLTQIKNTVSNLTDTAKELNLTLEPPKKRKVATISLYIPDTVNFQYNSTYANLSLLDAAKEVANAAAGTKLPIVSQLGKIGSGALSIGTSNAAKLALKSQGLAINPQQQLLFDGIDFRTYQMAFTFTPYSREEAETVKEIINLFKYHAAPQITNSGGGMFFIPPSTFDVDFLFNGSRNKHVNRVAESVIESIDVNYAPNGWSAHDNGAPTQTTLTMNFKEIALIDKTKIQEGY
jgi:hypothetical protein